MKRLFLVLALLTLAIITMSGQTQLKRYKFYYSYQQEQILKWKPGSIPMYYKGTPYTEIVPIDSAYTSKFSDTIYLGEGTVQEDVTFLNPPDALRIDSIAYNKYIDSLSFHLMNDFPNPQEFIVYVDPTSNEIRVSWKGGMLTIDEIVGVVDATDVDKTCLILTEDENSITIVGCKHPYDIGTAIWYSFKSRFRQ